MRNEDGKIMDYEEFIVNNRKTVNNSLNLVLWYCILTGPAIAIGVFAGIFPEVGYEICAQISLVMFLISALHYILNKRWPTSAVTSYFALAGLNILLVHMAYGHVYIYLTWFLVPLLSLLFCELKVFFVSALFNYIMMALSTWLTAPYYEAVRTDYDNVMSYFANVIGGFTIETIIMVAAGFALGRTSTRYFRDMIGNHKTILEHETQMSKQIGILDSMAEIYDRVNLIDFNKMTERSIKGGDNSDIELDFSVNDHTKMTQMMMDKIVPDMRDDFVRFTNITTVQIRLSGKKNITGEFIDKVNGWFRAQYITVNREEKTPTRVIFTIQSIDNEKRREEHLVRIAMTDELTRLYNRRCYEEDILNWNKEGISDDMVVFSIDVNGLKTANDTKGHAAGDELIRGAADTLMIVTGPSGKVYRTGGDEFIALVHIEDANLFMERVKVKASTWHGVYVESLSVSVGYASHKDNPHADMDELERIADQMMYADKAEYYRLSGIDRRRR